MPLKQRKMERRNNFILEHKLLKGEWNNEKIYEYKPNHFDLCIDKKRYFIFPENYNDLSDSEKVMFRNYTIWF